MNSEGAPKRDTEVAQQMKQLEKTIEEIYETVASLKSKLLPVLRQPPPAKIKTSIEEDLGSLVPLASTIRRQYNRLSECNQDIQEIIELCEL